jgi:REP element-mobilizing transposase RayT
LNIPNHCRSVKLDEFIVLPDHIHGVLFLRPNNIKSYENTNIARKNVAAGSLSAIIRSYKSAVTKTVNEVQQTPGKKFGPRNYYDRIIWNEKMLPRIQRYIENNPRKHWEEICCRMGSAC